MILRVQHLIALMWKEKNMRKKKSQLFTRNKNIRVAQQIRFRCDCKPHNNETCAERNRLHAVNTYGVIVKFEKNNKRI
jgi:hypothetical protein